LLPSLGRIFDLRPGARSVTTPHTLERGQSQHHTGHGDHRARPSGGSRPGGQGEAHVLQIGQQRERAAIQRRVSCALQRRLIGEQQPGRHQGGGRGLGQEPVAPAATQGTATYPVVQGHTPLPGAYRADYEPHALGRAEQDSVVVGAKGQRAGQHIGQP